MTWAEFQIRSYAYKRIQKEEWRKVREIAYTSLIAPYQDPKTIPKSREKYMPIDGLKKLGASIKEKAKKLMLERTKKYLEQRNG